MKYRIAVVGATGIVGRQVLQILQEKYLEDNDYFFYASDRSCGVDLNFAETKYCVKKLDQGIYNLNLDFALFCTKESVSKEYIYNLSQNGTKVVDFSSFYRKKKPLIVPEINSCDLKGNIICNPNCSTIGGVMALYKIHEMFGLSRIVYSTYQSVSGAGKDAIEDLNNKRMNPIKFKYPIFNNLIPYIGDIDKTGYSTEENKMIYETRKILKDRNIKVSATCVRVPIEVCHGESINFQTEKKCTISQIREVLKTTVGIKYVDEFPRFPMPCEVRGQDFVYVGRLRKDYSQKNTFNIFVVSDNLRKGAAQNGVQILQELIKNKSKNAKS